MSAAKYELFEFNDFKRRSKINVTLFCLLVYKITQLAGIQLTIHQSSKFLFGFLIIRPDFVLTDGATIFEGMSRPLNKAIKREHHCRRNFLPNLKGILLFKTGRQFRLLAN